MSDNSTPKENQDLKKFENFILDPDSHERRNYEEDLINNQTSRPEALFRSKILTNEFWEALGYKNSEIKIESPSGPKQIDYALIFNDKKIGIELKSPLTISTSGETKGTCITNDISKSANILSDQLTDYLMGVDLLIFTNGFTWYFYTGRSYLEQKQVPKPLDSQPYFLKIEANELFDKTSQQYIKNILSRKNILNSIKLYTSKAKQLVLSDINKTSKEFFDDLNIWMQSINYQLSSSDSALLTVTLINKLIFIRTMESYGILDNSYMCEQLKQTNFVRNMSIVDFIDSIDDKLTHTYNTELFLSKYIEDQDGDPLHEPPRLNKKRVMNSKYRYLNANFLKALLDKGDNADHKRTVKVVDKNGNKKIFNIKSMYAWKFDKISLDILGKAYETYLALERKHSGIYYTHSEITKKLSMDSIDKFFDEYIKQLKIQFEEDDLDATKIKNIFNKIIEFKVCDPSCGSGSFLIRAMEAINNKYDDICEILNKRMDRINLEKHKNEFHGLQIFEKQDFQIVDSCKKIIPNLKRTRLSLLILRHIYGNDSDPNAVSTAKLNIWLQCFKLAPNEFQLNEINNNRHVLPNLEINVTVGDSLMGLDTHYIDDKLKNEIKNYDNIGTELIREYFKSRKSYIDSPTNVIHANESVLKKTILVDHFNELFHNKLVSYTGNINGKKVTKLKDEEIKIMKSCLSKIIPCNWPIQFIDVYYFDDGTPKPSNMRGFDLILGNPPWEVLKPEGNDFFGAYYNKTLEGVGKTKYANLSDSKKQQFIKKLLKKNHIKNEWNEFQNIIYAQKNYLTEKIPHTRPYTMQGGSDPNLYKIFTELYLQCIKPKGGMLGVVLPSAIYLDSGSKELREYIFKNFKINYLYDFDNHKVFFEDVHAQYKFIILSCTMDSPSKTFSCMFSIDDPTKIEQLDTMKFDYEIESIEKWAPTSKTLFALKSKNDYQILKKIYKHDLLQNPNWNLSFKDGMHMTNEKRCFNENRDGVPLYEGKMFEQFITLYQINNVESLLSLGEILNWKKSNVRYHISKKYGEEYNNRVIKSVIANLESKFKKCIRENTTDGWISITKKERNDLHKKIDGIEKFNESHLTKFTKKKIHEYVKNNPILKENNGVDYRLVWRRISNATNTRTFISTILPPDTFVGNSIAYVRPFTYAPYCVPIPIKRIVYLCGIMNSFVFDYIMRFRVFLNIELYKLYEMPVPVLNEKDPIHKKIIELAGGLVCVSDKYDDLKSVLGINESFLIPNITELDRATDSNIPERSRADAICDLNIFAAMAYGINVSDFKYILNTFSDSAPVKNKILRKIDNLTSFNDL